MKKALTLSLILVGYTLSAQDVFTKSGEAIRGYDPVSYFTTSQPVKGSNDFTTTWKDALWKFASQKNLDAFKSDPEKFAPQFGGYCAYGMAEGHKASTSPNAWTIVDGKLYLNYNMDVKTLWTEKQLDYIGIAQKNWPTIRLEKD
jgi:hypothetical protein